MTRAAHLEWAKQRAREYLDRGEWEKAWSSFAADLVKHRDLEQHAGIQRGARSIFAGFLQGVDDMRRFIEGFN